MAVDLDEIQKAIYRIKERSFTPSVVDHLAELLSEALADLIRLPAELDNLQSQLNGAREQSASIRASAESECKVAGEALASAKALEASHEETIAIAHGLGLLMAECDALRTDRNRLVQALTAAKADAESAGDEARMHAAELRAECDVVRTRDAAKQAALDEIAALPWWKAHVAKRIAHAEPRS